MKQKHSDKVESTRVDDFGIDDECSVKGLSISNQTQNTLQSVMIKNEAKIRKKIFNGADIESRHEDREIPSVRRLL